MITNDERREVAQKLRFNAYTALHMNTSDDFAREVFRAAMNEEIADYRAAIKRLADLIEPTMPSDPGEAGLTLVEGFIGEMRHSTKEEQDEYNAMMEKMSVELHPVDRDALLRIAEDLDYEGMGGWADTVNVGGYARRIREALGVDE